MIVRSVTIPYDKRLRAVAPAGESNDIVRAAELRKRMILCIGLHTGSDGLQHIA